MIRVRIEKLTEGDVIILNTKFMVGLFEKVTFEQNLKGGARSRERFMCGGQRQYKALRKKPACST